MTGETDASPARRTRAQRLARIVAVPLVLAALVHASFQVSPWPGALLVRAVFGIGDARTVAALQKHVPAGITAHIDAVYDPNDPNGRLDVYHPQEGTAPLTTVVWIHGGGWVSGDKAHVGPYARVLAARGFTVVSVQYSVAPEARYPTPVRQTMMALAYLTARAAAYRIDPDRIVLAGDSAGAQIAAQTAAIISAPDYARAVDITPGIERRQIIGTLLFCGGYDTEAARGDGVGGWFVHTVLWAYSGRKDFMSDPVFRRMDVTEHLTAAFPPAFISVGNGDPLAPQSVALANRLQGLGVRVDRLFFPADHRPSLPHEYQFNLDNAEGRMALERAVAFLKAL
jgi:acetyl esterase/lipase